MAFNNIYTLIGGRSKGKTPFILGGDYERGVAKIYLEQRRMSILIIDELDHPKYRHVPILHPDNYSILSKTPAIYRTLCKMQDMPKLFPRLLDVWNTAIVFEDCNKYFARTFTKEQLAIIGNSKNQNNDLIFMHWCWGFVQPDLFRITNFYVIFQTADSPECRKTYLQASYKDCINAYDNVMKGVEGRKPYIIVDSGI